MILYKRQSLLMGMSNQRKIIKTVLPSTCNFVSFSDGKAHDPVPYLSCHMYYSSLRPNPLRTPRVIDGLPLLWIIYVISVLVLLYFRAHLFIDALWSLAGKELTSWLSFVMSNCEVITFPLVCWVRCGA